MIHVFMRVSFHPEAMDLWWGKGEAQACSSLLVCSPYWQWRFFSFSMRAAQNRKLW